MSAAGLAIFPRSIDRGLIEALPAHAGPGFAEIHFRDQLIAASLKLLGLPGTGCRKNNFRDQLIAASLKHDGIGSTHTDKLLFPRSIDRGLIEAPLTVKSLQPLR